MTVKYCQKIFQNISLTSFRSYIIAIVLNDSNFFLLQNIHTWRERNILFSLVQSHNRGIELTTRTNEFTKYYATVGARACQESHLGLRILYFLSHPIISLSSEIQSTSVHSVPSVIIFAGHSNFFLFPTEFFKAATKADFHI